MATTMERLVVLAAVALGCVDARGQWTQPTPEELSMTSIAEVPGAAAVYLYREDITDDPSHEISRYVRLKVLTEKGKEYATVEIPYQEGHWGYKVASIAGRSIHPDGSVTMLKDKPYEKLVEKFAGYKEKEKVFTVPAVEVGSIIEYRYKLQYDDNMLFRPEWIVQSDLYLRRGYFRWKPTVRSVNSEDGTSSSTGVAWTPILPAGVQVGQKGREITLDVHDIAPLPKEEYMPPIRSLSYRVMFYYSDVRDPKIFWDHYGEHWTQDVNLFMGPYKGVQAYAASLVLPGDAPDLKARKLYGAVMQLENTDFTRERSRREEKAGGYKPVASTDDLLTRKRGSGDQLALLFVSMCRSVGLKAYLMAVADRSQRIFLSSYLSTRQLDDYIAIVVVDGKDVYFDPGQRYCGPERLTWKHMLVGGIRQTDGGTALATTPGVSYSAERVSRIADLSLDEQGMATGTATLTFTGDRGLQWRQEALVSDDAALNEDLKKSLEQMLPAGMEVRVTSVGDVAAYDKPLVVKYEVKGSVGSAVGKRLAVPIDLFEANEKPKFPEPKREVAVDMRYPSITLDAVRIKYPVSLTVESSPTPAKAAIEKAASFETMVKPGTQSITMYRNLINSKTLYLADAYNDLRSFYTKVELADQETVVLKRMAGTIPARDSTSKGREAKNNENVGEAMERGCGSRIWRGVRCGCARAVDAADAGRAFDDVDCGGTGGGGGLPVPGRDDG